ncbi:M16 family metallopeptidase, partial [Porphyromonas catoniae]
MRLKQQIRTLFSALLLAGVAGGLLPLKAQEPGGGMPPLPIDSAVRIGKLPNGLTYFIRHNAEPKERAEFYIVQRVGSMQEEDSQQGLAHFLEHIAFNGTKNFPGKGIDHFLESIGASFGRNINAYTSFDETVYTLMNIPVPRKSVVDSCVLILHDWSNFISLEDKEIDLERGVIEEEWRSRDNGDMRNMTKMLELAFPNNKYGQRMPIGKMEIVRNFPYQVLRDYYKKWYRPDQQALVIVG